MLLFGLWKFIPERLLTKWLIGTSFSIYMLHMAVCRCLDIAFNFTVENIQEWIVKWLIGVESSLFAAMALLKLWPRLASVVFGGR